VIGLDTNVIVRYVVQDDARQSAAATRLIERSLSPENPGFIGCITLCETAWVLAECYGAGREKIGQVLEGLLASKQLVVEQPEAAWKALRAWRGSSADFADALIGQIVAANGGAKTVTFDRAAAKLPGLELLS
jgi:predicted nucleic-acid-binding protein